MSIVESLKRLFDPAAHRYEEGERQAQREQRQEDEDGGPPDFEVVARPQVLAAVPLFRCRLCAREEGQGEYCPDCLAETMVEVEAGGAGG